VYSYELPSWVLGVTVYCGCVRLVPFLLRYHLLLPPHHCCYITRHYIHCCIATLGIPGYHAACQTLFCYHPFLHTHTFTAHTPHTGEPHSGPFTCNAISHGATPHILPHPFSSQTPRTHLSPFLFPLLAFTPLPRYY